MATPEINENCHYVENDPHSCYGVIKESLQGGRNPPLPPGKIGLSKLALFKRIVLFSEMLLSEAAVLVYKKKQKFFKMLTTQILIFML